MFYVELKINNIIWCTKVITKDRRVILTRLYILRHAPDVRPRERLSRIFAQAYLKTAILNMPFQYYAQ
jgi:hypothetical protein